MKTPEEPIDAAARWLASLPKPPTHVIPTLKERFGLTGLQACQAIALARQAHAPKTGGAP